MNKRKETQAFAPGALLRLAPVWLATGLACASSLIPATASPPMATFPPPTATPAPPVAATRPPADPATPVVDSSTSSPSPAVTPTPIPVISSTTNETRGAVTLALTVTTRYYPIEGATAAEMDKQMRRLGPIDQLGGYHWFALTVPVFDWRYPCLCEGGNCTTGPPTLYLTLNYAFPRWFPPDGVEGGLVAQWEAFEAALTEHERGHGALATDCAWSLGEAFVALPPQATCSAVGEVVLIASERGFADCREAQRAYENDTDHGRTQGVIWPPE